MSKVSQYGDISNVKTLEDLITFAARAIDDLVTTINGKLDFQNNINCQLANVSFTAVNGEVAISHNLKRVPTGFLVYSVSTATVPQTGVTPWTSSAVYLRCQTTGNASVIIF